MAASTSRQPHQIPLPPSPSRSTKSRRSRKGKGKENLVENVQRGPGEPNDISFGDFGSDPSWDWAYLSDPSASKVPPIFTKDGSYFFSLVGPSVKIHSVTTGEVVSTLSAPRSSSNGIYSNLLTAAVLNPHNAFQLITGSIDGRLVIWDFLDASLLQIIDIAQPIHYICAHELFKDTVFVGASRARKKSESDPTHDRASVLRVSLKSFANTTKSTEILPIGKTQFPTGLVLSPNGAWLIATASHKVFVAKTSSLSLGFTKYVSPERLTCLAFHPHEEYFATGDEKGVVRLWYCLSDRLPVTVRGVEKKTQTMAWHWHAHAVSCIAFSTNGAYLLSGGEEAVLVVWQLHTGRKEFVPRVSAPISTVSVLKAGDGEEEYLLGLIDATYLFVSSGNLRISRSYSRIKLDCTINSDLPSSSRHRFTPLAIHKLTSTLILPSSHPSSLQIYSPFSSKVISELEVSPSNRVSRRDEKPIEPSFVEQVAVSLSGEWLASIDARDGSDGVRGEIYLKFWRWDRKSSRWILNTRIDRPHGLRKVTSLAFSPSSVTSQPIQLVTTGEDGYVKMWRLRTVQGKSETTEEFWVTRSRFGFRSQVPWSTTWSMDGSLLAVSYGQYVTIYDPITSALYRHLTSPECRISTSVHFIGKKGRYIAVFGKYDLVLWDLVAESVRWHYKALSIIDRVIPHEREDSFTVFHSHLNQEQRMTRISVFSVGSHQPLNTYSVPFGLRNALSYSFTSHTTNRTFIGITQDWGVVLIGDDVKAAKEEGATAREHVSGVVAPRTLFQDIFGESAFSNPLSAPLSTVQQAHIKSGTTATEIFDSPAYLMPPLGHLFEPLMNGLLKLRLEEPVVHVSRDDGNIDTEEEDAEPLRVGSQRKQTMRPEEMNTFIDIFRRHSVNRSPDSVVYVSNANKAISNTVAPRFVSPVVKDLKRNSTPRLQPSSKVTPTSPPSIPATNGRKRKKSPY